MLKQIGIQFTNRCNSDCIMCDRRLSKRPIRDMQPDELHKIVNEIKELGANDINHPTGCCGIGEAILHPQFNNMIDILRKIHWCFGSNSWQLNEDLIEKILLSQPTHLTLSMNAFTQHTMKKISSTIQINKCIENIQTAIEIKSCFKTHTKLYIQFIIMKQNYEELEDWIRFWLPQIEKIENIFLYIKPVIAWVGMPDTDKFYPAPYFNINKSLSKEEWFKNKIIFCDEPESYRNGCTLLWNFAWVRSDGVYMPCCMTSEDLWDIGNVFETSIKECYESDKMKEYRRQFRIGDFDKIPLCKDCK